MMTILYVSSEYPPETGFGGIGTYTKTIAEAIAQRGHAVHVVSLSQTNATSVTSRNGVAVHRIPPIPYPLPQGRAFFIFRQLCYKTIPNTLIRVSWSLAVKRYIKNLSRSIKFDIIEYAECGAEGAFVCSTSKKFVRLHTPWFWIRQLDSMKESLFDKVLLDSLEKRSIRQAHVITAPCTSVIKVAQQKWSITNAKVFPNPIDYSSYQVSNGEDWIYLGRIEQRKGVDILLKAYAIANKARKLPALQLIGRPYGFTSDGTAYESYIKELIEQSGCKEKITWIQGVEHHQVQSYLHKSRIAFFPSVWENFSYACLESMACGLTVVASNVGGFSEFIENKSTGLLFPKADIFALAELMKWSIDNRSTLKLIGDNARKYIQKNLDSSILAQQIENLYACAMR